MRLICVTPLTRYEHLCYIHSPGPTPHVGPIQGKVEHPPPGGTKGSPMSRNSLHRPRHTRAVWDRPATGTRLSPYPFPPTTPLHIPHYKRCPKAHRLRLRSDQSLSLPVYVTGYGRFPDKKRLALSKGQCQVRAALNRRIRFASSGDALEHSVMSPPRAIVPPWAIAPCSDSHGLDLAGQSEQSDERRLKTNAPFLDSAVAALAGQSEQSDERRLKTNAPFLDSAVAALAGQSEQSDERRLKTNAPFLDSTVVTTGELPTTNAGHGSPLPSLGMVERFWWTRLPHSETSSRLLHIPPEVRGCRKAGVDVEHPLSRKTPIGTGVAVFLRKRPGPSIPSPSARPPQSREKRTFPAKQSDLTPGSAHQSKLPHSYPPKGAAQQPIPSTPPPTTK